MMKKFYLIIALVVFAFGASACDSGNTDDNTDNKDNQDDTQDDNGDEETDVDDDTLDDLTEILSKLQESFDEWEGKRLVNKVEMEDPEDAEKTLDVETTIQVDDNGDRIYAETYDVTDEDQPVQMNYLYLEDGMVYTYENAEAKAGDDNEDTYRKQDESDREAELPDVEGMFSETLQLFPANHSTAEMQGFKIQDATLDYDEDNEAYQADVEVLAQTAEQEEKEEVWSLEGDMEEITIDMPMPTLGTVTFDEADFDDTVESIDTSRHSEEETSDDSE